MAELRILAVDDDPVTLALLAKRLQLPEYRLDTEGDGAIALERLGTTAYDVIITDLMMPGEVDGLGVLQAAKSRQPGAEVLLLTGHASVHSAVAAMKQGAFDYLQKPINFDELHMVLDRIAGLRRLSRDSDELRQAMEITERNASETIGRLEMEVARLRDILEKITRCLQHDSGDAGRKLEKVGALVSSAGQPL